MTESYFQHFSSFSFIFIKQKINLLIDHKISLRYSSSKHSGVNERRKTVTNDKILQEGFKFIYRYTT